MRKIKTTDIFYNYRNLGLSLWAEQKQIFTGVDLPSRLIPYKRLFQTAVTYEIDMTHYEMTRKEFTFFDWLSAVGGLGSIVFAVSNAAGALDNAQMFVTSALLPPEDKPEEKVSYSATFSPSEVQDKCCVTMRAKLAVHRKMPACCKCGGTKGRILGAVHEDMKNCMYIHNLFKHLRTTEGIIRERLNVSD